MTQTRRLVNHDGSTEYYADRDLFEVHRKQYRLAQD